MAKAVRKVTPFTKTVAVNHSEPGGMFVTDWGVTPGRDESMERLDKRRAQGQKMTPKLGGRLVPRGR